MWSRVLVVVKAAPTWLVFAATVVQIIVDELGDDLPAVAQIGGSLLAWIAAAVAIIRRVTPVLPDERGLLPRGGTPGDAVR